MIINFLGDSITQGSGASEDNKSFFYLLVDRFKEDTLINYGIGGTRIARQYSLYSPTTYKISEYMRTFYNLDFNLRAPMMNKEADLVFVFGGTNDFGHGDAPIGDIDDKDELTYCGAINVLVDTLVKTYGKENVIFILPLPRYDMDSTHGSNYSAKRNESEVLSVYINKEKEVLLKKGVKCLDFSEYFPRPVDNTNKGLFFDGLHPNDAGHLLLADLIEKEIINFKNQKATR